MPAGKVSGSVRHGLVWVLVARCRREWWLREWSIFVPVGEGTTEGPSREEVGD